MKIIFFTLWLMLIVFKLWAQPTQSRFEGYWYGLLEAQGSELIITLELFSENDSLKGFMHSPMQGANNIEITEIKSTKDSISIFVRSLGARYNAVISDNDSVLEGIFRQAIFNIPMRMVRTAELFAFSRPQEPVPPFDYLEEEVTFYNAHAGINLAGTLTYPKGAGPFPAVVLITGSGPQNRDEEILGHKPFLIIADYFSNRGIAVLRFDDRGIGQSEGDFGAATSKDFATDAEAAFDFLLEHPKIDASKVGLLGHSEGGMIAPMIAAQNDKVSFVIMLAGPALSGDEVLLTQIQRIMALDGTHPEYIETILNDSRRVYRILKRQRNKEKAANAIRRYLMQQAKKIPEEKHIKLGYTRQAIEMKIHALNSDWFRYFLAFNPEKYLRNVSCPLLALFGEKDVQVTVPENVEAMERIIKRRKKNHFTVHAFPGKNHLFQNATTGHISEYALIEETISPDVLEKMTNWLHKVLE